MINSDDIPEGTTAYLVPVEEPLEDDDDEFSLARTHEDALDYPLFDAEPEVRNKLSKGRRIETPVGVVKVTGFAIAGDSDRASHWTFAEVIEVSVANTKMELGDEEKFLTGRLLFHLERDDQYSFADD